MQSGGASRLRHDLRLQPTDKSRLEKISANRNSLVQTQVFALIAPLPYFPRIDSRENEGRCRIGSNVAGRDFV